MIFLITVTVCSFYIQIHPTRGSSVRTMTVEEGHVLNIDGVAASSGNGTSGGAGTGSTANKYKQSPGSTADRAASGVGRGPSLFQTQGISNNTFNFLLIYQ